MENGMMKTPRDIKIALNCIHDHFTCDQCPYDKGHCADEVNQDALAYIELLETKIKQLSKELEEVENKLSELLCYVTGGRSSKTGYSIQDMKYFADDYFQDVCAKCDDVKEFQEELEKVKRERDAAVNDIEKCLHAKGEDEPECKMCNMQKPECDWECEKSKWRGVQENK